MSDPEEQQEEPEPIGWQVLDRDGNVVTSGGQAVLEAASDAGEGDLDGGD